MEQLQNIANNSLEKSSDEFIFYLWNPSKWQIPPNYSKMFLRRILITIALLRFWKKLILQKTSKIPCIPSRINTVGGFLLDLGYVVFDKQGNHDFNPVLNMDCGKQCMLKFPSGVIRSVSGRKSFKRPQTVTRTDAGKGRRRLGQNFLPNARKAWVSAKKFQQSSPKCCGVKEDKLYHYVCQFYPETPLLQADWKITPKLKRKGIDFANRIW